MYFFFLIFGNYLSIFVVKFLCLFKYVFLGIIWYLFIYFNILIFDLVVIIDLLD